MLCVIRQLKDPTLQALSDANDAPWQACNNSTGLRSTVGTQEELKQRCHMPPAALAT